MEPNRLRLAADGGDGARPEASSFNRNVLSLLERVEYRRCDSGEDLEALYRLRYKAYRTHGIVGDVQDQSISDSLDETDNCYRFGVFIDNELASTVRVHHLTREEPFSPAMAVFSDVLGPRLEAGDSFIDPSRLAADPDLVRMHRPLPYLTLRLAVIASAWFDTTSCLSMIREEHSAFYQRIFGAVQVGDPRPYASVNVLAILFESRCAMNMLKTVNRFPFFRSTRLEQRMLFGTPVRSGLAPLTVLPTAKYLNAAA